tara:strand:+ start:320 stop:1432 length:1113 start_codon:yes stop_codon:yes gene_type:complete
MKKGSIYTVAGCGKVGSEGDGGDAKLAMLNEPKDVTIDNNGCLYIADSENNLIRSVNSNGSINTIAGSFTSSETEEDKELGETEYQRILDTVSRKAGMNAELIGDDGAAISAKLRFPSAIAVDQDGNLYISDTYNHRVRKLNRKNGVITTIAGNGEDGLSGDNGPATEASLSEPTGIAVDREGNIYIADLRNNKIRIVEGATGIIKTFAGNGDNYFSGDDGPAVNASLSGPSDVVLGKNKNIFIADTFNNIIRMVDANTGIITTVAGDGDRFKITKKETTAKSLARPYSIALDSKGNILTTDSDNHLIRKIDGNTGEITTLAGNGKIGFSTDGTPADKAALNYPFGMAIDSKDNIYVADTFNHRIRKILN